jgi:hypothetical protein
MQVQRRSGRAGGEGHLHYTHRSVAVCLTQQNPQRLRDSRSMGRLSSQIPPGTLTPAVMSLSTPDGRMPLEGA